MGPRINTRMALALEATITACALLGGVRLTWMAMEGGWARLNHRINACYLPARWAPAPPPPVRATSMLSTALPLREAPPVKADDHAARGWAYELSERRIDIFPEIRNGKPIGFRVSRLQSGGSLERIGLQNGDVVLAINGYHLTSPDKALAAYMKLKRANHLSIEIERNGFRTTIELDLVPSPRGRGEGIGISSAPPPLRVLR
jgi:PDZ domain-containing protein